MDSFIRKTLAEKDIQISDHILQEVTSRWKSVNTMKNETPPLPTSVTDLALRNIPRGDDNEL